MFDNPLNGSIMSATTGENHYAYNKSSKRRLANGFAPPLSSTLVVLSRPSLGCLGVSVNLFSQVPHDFIQRTDLSMEAKSLFILLQSYTSPTNPKPFPSRRTLMYRTGWGRDRLLKYQGELERAGLLLIQQRRNGVKWSTNLFTLIPTQLRQAVLPSQARDGRNRCGRHGPEAGEPVNARTQRKRRPLIGVKHVANLEGTRPTGRAVTPAMVKVAYPSSKVTAGKDRQSLSGSGGVKSVPNTSQRGVCELATLPQTPERRTRTRPFGQQYTGDTIGSVTAGETAPISCDHSCPENTDTVRRSVPTNGKKKALAKPLSFHEQQRRMIWNWLLDLCASDPAFASHRRMWFNAVRSDWFRVSVALSALDDRVFGSPGRGPVKSRVAWLHDQWGRVPPKETRSGDCVADSIPTSTNN